MVQNGRLRAFTIKKRGAKMSKKEDIYNALRTFVDNDFDGDLTHMTLLVDGTREDIYDALRSFASVDNDFNGENGEKYLVDQAKAKGFNSNLEYYINELDQYKDDEQAVRFFMDKWLGCDNYYEQYSVGVIKGFDNKIKVLSLAFTSDL